MWVAQLEEVQAVAVTRINVSGNGPPTNKVLHLYEVGELIWGLSAKDTQRIPKATV